MRFLIPLHAVGRNGHLWGHGGCEGAQIGGRCVAARVEIGDLSAVRSGPFHHLFDIRFLRSPRPVELQPAELLPPPIIGLFDVPRLAGRLCRICPALYLFVELTSPPQVYSFSFHLVPITPIRSSGWPGPFCPLSRNSANLSCHNWKVPLSVGKRPTVALRWMRLTLKQVPVGGRFDVPHPGRCRLARTICV